MKILITGGCGFLGSNLTSRAIKLGYEVIVFDNLFREGSSYNLQWLKGLGPFEYCYGDIRNYNDVYGAINKYKPDFIFHVAGQVAMTTSIANPRLDFEINALGTHNLLESIRLCAPECGIIYSSTNKVYGDLEQYTYLETEKRYVCNEMPNGFDESVLLDFRSPYGCSKGTADQYVLDYSRVFGLKTVVLRHSSMYGGRQYATYDQGWIGWFCEVALKIKNHILKDPFTISGNGKQVRDVLHAEDMIDLYYSIAQNIDTIKGQVFNIGGGINNSLSLLELFDLLENELDVKLSYDILPVRKSDQKVFVADINKIKKYCGWQPKVDALSGIRQMLEWVETK